MCPEAWWAARRSLRPPRGRATSTWGCSGSRPGAQSRPHYHENCESAVYMLSGSLRVKWGDHLEQELTLEPGDLVYVPPRETHVLENARPRRSGRVRGGAQQPLRGRRRRAVGGGAWRVGAAQQVPELTDTPGPELGSSTVPPDVDRCTAPRCTTYQMPRQEIREAIPQGMECPALAVHHPAVGHLPVPHAVLTGSWGHPVNVGGGD